MPPRLVFPRSMASRFQPSQTSHEFATQWSNPSDVFSVLLILGGDVINCALAQLAGNGICPVAFSFGWVAYAISAVSAAFGENRLMPLPDCACKVINAKTRYERDNTSWIIGRVVRDFESWRDPRIDQALKKMLHRKWEEKKQHAKRECPGSELNMPRPKYGGLCVSIYQAGDAMPGSHGRDLAYYSGFAVAALQLVIAAIPCGIWGDWGVMLIVTAGIILSFAMGSLPQWVKEKWACRTIQSKKTFVLVRGNGSGHAIVIRCDGRGLDLEDLAAGPVNVNVHTSTFTRVAVVGFAFLWIALLITAAGIRRNTWFLLAVGAFGILQNLYVAGGVRDPAAFGMPLIYEDVIVETKAMETLYKVEERYPGVGRSLLNTFFPGHLRPEEIKRWEMIERESATGSVQNIQHSGTDSSASR